MPEVAAKVDEIVSTIRQAVPEFKQKALSAAAKIDLIVREQHRAVPIKNIGDLAKNLGWKLTDDEVRQSVEVLKQLNLITTEASK
jgi:hypothetical protein